ncbi:MAG: glycosyltransferase family 1 protein [Pseudolysinimonas sp.]
MSRPRLLIFSFSNISADARVLKQVARFAEDYEVTTCGYGPSPDARVEHLRLDDANGIRRWRRRDLILRRYRRMYWTQAGVRQARAELTGRPRFDVVLANDVDTVPLALQLDPARGVHADIHEYAPRLNEELLVWRVFEAPYARWLCRRFLARCASMTTVGQGIADEYLRRFGIRSGVVTNAAPYAELEPRPVGSPIRLVHSGASLRNRRLEVLVAAAMSTSSDVTLDLYLMGNDPDYVAELRARAAGSERVRFPEAVPYRHLIARLNEYDVGMHVIAPTNFNNRWALPNKFFDYVQARLALVIGPSAEMESLVHVHHLGAVAAGFDAAAVTAVLDSLTAERVRGWKSNAAAAAHSLSSETQVEVWARAIRQLIEQAAA